MITVAIPVQLRRETGGRFTLDINLIAQTEDRTIRGLLDCIEVEAPGVKARLLDTEGKLRDFINIYVDDKEARFLARGQDFGIGLHVNPDPLDLPLTGYEDISILPKLASRKAT